MLQRGNTGFGIVPLPKQNVQTGKPKVGKPLRLGTSSGRGISSLPQKTIQKLSNLSGSDMQNYWGTGNMSTFTPELRNPTLQSDMFFLPKYYSPDGFPNTELNVWIDHYLRFQPLVHNLVDLHATLPISRFGLVKLSDTKVLDVFEQMAEDMQMETMNHYILKGYFGKGESQPYAWWNEDKNRWDGMTLIDTNYITVQGHYLLHARNGEPSEYYTLSLDEYIQNLVHSNDSFEQEKLVELLEDDFKYAILNNLQLRLDPFSTTLIKRKLNWGDLRGTSIMTNCLKPLMLEDKLRENDFASAQMNINPIRLWTYGNDLIPADDEMLGDLRDMVRNASYDPQFHIFSNHLLKLDIKGAVGTVQELQPKWEYIENQILTALWGNKAFTHSEGITYNNGTTAMRVLMGRYLPVRAMLENYYYQKIFLPVSFANEFFPSTNAELAHNIVSKDSKRPLYPRFDWKQKQSLYDDQNTRNLLIQLQAASKMPMKVICDSLDLDYQYVVTWLQKEMNTVLDNDYIAGKKQLIISAIAGTLQDKGSNMVKRMISAGAAFVKLVTGSDENLSVKEPEEDADKLQTQPASVDPENLKDDKKESKLSLTSREKLELQDKLGLMTEYEKFQEKENKRIIRQNSPYVEKVIAAKKQAGKFTNHQTVQGIGNKTLKELYNSYYPSAVVTLVGQQLNNLKIEMGKEKQTFLAKRGSINTASTYSINDSLNNVIGNYKENYEKNLFLVGKIATNEMLKKLGNQDIDNFVSGVETYSPLDLKTADLEVIENNVLSAYWDSLYPKLEHQVVSGFVNFIKKCEIDVIEKCGIKNCYFNMVSMSLDDIKQIKEFKASDRLLPDTGLKITADYSHFNAHIKNVPIELEHQIFDTLARFPLSGEIDLTGTGFTNSKYNPTLVENYIGAKFVALGKEDKKIEYAELQDLYNKYFNNEKDEYDFFVKHSKQYLFDKIENEDLRKYLFKIY